MPDNKNFIICIASRLSRAVTVSECQQIPQGSGNKKNPEICSGPSSHVLFNYYISLQTYYQQRHICPGIILLYHSGSGFDKFFA